ncbi:MAG: segregation/condensation protein A [Candidatus Goldbacteria bacterium]|nr:segregation/condensation protein A [Candidatus Goldiibacteriota bacterium]
MQENYQLKLAVFEGPFDLLLYLIKKNQIDIYDIPIATITEEYLSYIEMLENLNLNVASEFIVIAATLLYIKSKMLLPKDDILEQEEDPRMDLVQHLIEYNTYKELSEKMRVYELKKRDLFERLYPITVAGEDKELSIDIYTLVKAMDDVLGRIKERRLIVIPGEKIRVKDRIFELVEMLKKQENVRFFSICDGGKSRLYVISLFLAILELLRLKVVGAYQEETFGDIVLTLKDKNVDMDFFRNIEG